MASEGDVVRVTHHELVKLAENYKSREPKESAQHANKDKQTSGIGRRSKRPDLQLYRPGRFRGVPVNSSDGVNEEGDEEDPDDDQHSSGDRGSSVEKDMDDMAQVNQIGMTDKKQRRKRPEIQLYVPKRRQQAIEEQPSREESAECDDIQANSDLVDTTTAERKIDLQPNSVRVTVANEDASQSKGRWKLEQSKQRHNPEKSRHPLDHIEDELEEPQDRQSKRRGVGGNRGRHHQVIEQDNENLHDLSHDSLEWDYDYHDVANNTYGNDVVESVVFTNSNYSQHSRKDRGGKGRNRKDRRGNQNDSHQPEVTDTGQDRRHDQKRQNKRRVQGSEPGSSQAQATPQGEHNHRKHNDSEKGGPSDHGVSSKGLEPDTNAPKPQRRNERRHSGGQRDHNKQQKSKPDSLQTDTKQSPLLPNADRKSTESLSDILEPMVISGSWGEEVEKEEIRERMRDSEEKQLFSQHDSIKDNHSKGKHGELKEHSVSKSEQRKGKKGRNDNRRSNGDEKAKGLKVTFAQNERQVKVLSDRETSSEEKELRGGDGQRGGRGGHQPRGGGILHLPTAATRPQPVQEGQSKSHQEARGHQVGHPPRGRGGTRGRGSHRQLYDPNNPKKPLNISAAKPLHFHDPYDQYSPTDTGSPYMAPPMDYYYEYQMPSHAYYEYKGSPQADYMYYLPAYNENVSYHDDTYARDPYYHSGHEAENMIEGSRSDNRAKAEALLREVQPLDGQLNSMLYRRIQGQEALQQILALRREVQKKYEQIVLLDPDVSNKHSVEQLLWKSAFYQVIEMLRKHMPDDGDQNSLREALLELLDEGNTFYETLLKKLQTTFCFNLEVFLDTSHTAPEHISRTVKLALLSTQRSMICLGDISRYKEQAHHTANYGKARNWYLKAQQIAPKNGRPYNQLAILAVYTRRKLDAVYYYMRSLAASNPFITARESLMSLFDEARKKAEVSERRKVEERQNQKQQLARLQEDRNRREVWISPDGSRSDGVIPLPSLEQELQTMSAVDLNKQFILSFLNVHGKLFTKIGMERFPEISSQLLKEFRCLLQHSPSPLGNARLLQLMAINMCAIQNTVPQEDMDLDESCRPLIQEQAVGLGLDMFALLVTRCVELFKQHLSMNDIQVMSEDLQQLFPSIKVWADWMSCYPKLWNPPPISRDPQLGPIIDVWKALADLCNVLKRVDITHVKLYSEKRDSCDVVVLGEDLTMAGFVPLLCVPQIPKYVHNTVDKEIARDCSRIDKMRTFGDYLCGIDHPLLSYNVEKQQYISIAPENCDLSENEELYAMQESEDVLVESESSEEEAGEEAGDDNMRELRSKRERLRKLQEEKQRLQQSVEKVLRSGEVRPMQLEITPLFLVPDTNCFIDHLNGIQALLNTKRFTVIVPLVVINELDGLAKGTREGKYSSLHHGEMVKEGSASAVLFLEAQFGKRNPNLRALTAKGSVLDTISFRSEETMQEGSNDDLILSCCLHYCKDKARDFMPKDDDTPIVLHREVVLLTDDRNLRLKAHTRNVPVRDIPAFMRWAKVG